MEIDKCFFCSSSDLYSRSVGSGDGGGEGGGDVGGENRKEASIKLILNYLLGFKNNNNGELSLTEDIISLWRRGLGQGQGEGQGGVGEAVKFCGRCDHLTGYVSELHLQLEEIQMKIINLVESLRSLVIQNCSSSRIAKDNGEGEDHSVKLGETETLSLFQSVVSSEAKKLKSVKVPFVLLDKCFKSAHQTFLLVKNDASDATPDKVTKVNIKTEPEELEEADSPPSPDNFDEDYHSYLESISQEPLPVKQDLQVQAPPLPPPQALDDDHDWLPSPEKKSTESGRKLRKKKPLIPPKLSKRQKSSEEPSKTEHPDIEYALEELPFGVQLKASVIKVTKKRGRKKGTKNSGIPKPPKLPKPIPPPSFSGLRTKRKYSCATCPSGSSFTTKSLHKFHFHLRKHETGERNHKCLNCPEECWLSGQQLYEFHVACHQGRFKLMCDLCTKRVDHFFLKDHMKSCYSSDGTEVPKVFPCPNCAYCTSIRDKYLEHLRDHDQTGIHRCDICNLEVPTRRKLLQHLFDVHEAIEKRPCGHPGCDKSYLDTFQLWNHEQQHKRQFGCSTCGKQFGNPHYLKIHRRSHTGERPHVCPECGEGHKTKADLQRHQINHHGAQRYQCHFCEKSYTDPGSLTNHLRLHTGTGFPCDQCGKLFMSQALLGRHLPVHSKSRNFVCEACGKAFRTKETLSSHRKTHLEVKRFKCEHCQRAFKLNQHLVAHLRTHTGERPFVCDICGASFTQAGPLISHKKKHKELI